MSLEGTFLINDKPHPNKNFRNADKILHLTFQPLPQRHVFKVLEHPFKRRMSLEGTPEELKERTVILYFQLTEWGIIALSFVMFRCRDLFIASHSKISDKVAPIAGNIQTAFRCPFMQWIQFLQQGAFIDT